MIPVSSIDLYLMVSSGIEYYLILSLYLQYNAILVPAVYFGSLAHALLEHSCAHDRTQSAAFSLQCGQLLIIMAVLLKQLGIFLSTGHGNKSTNVNKRRPAVTVLALSCYE